MTKIRCCDDADFNSILTIINAAAERYRGVIPEDRWHDPYMPAGGLRAEIEAGVTFCGMETSAGQLIGVMGIQRVRDVVLIRHAYVRPDQQGKGVGGALLKHLRALETGPMLIGTWMAAEWAIAFYQRHGFQLVPNDQVPTLLRTYWNISERQAEASVVLADSPVETLEAFR